jgi:hypothetical protein
MLEQELLNVPCGKIENLTPSPPIHELLKHQSQYQHHSPVKIRVKLHY